MADIRKGGKEGMKYKTWEVVKMLTENPKLKFRHDICAGGTKFLTIKGQTRLVCEKDMDCLNAEIFTDTEWELIKPEPVLVPFMEAVKAYSEGKTIGCKDGKHNWEYEPSEFSPKFSVLNDTKDGVISAHEILNGQWYIIEGEEG
jgi:hypothetical protein